MNNLKLLSYFSFKCKRCFKNVQTTLPPENSDCTSDYSQWYHASSNKGIPDDILSKAWDISNNVSFVFHHRSAKQEAPVEPEKKIKKNKKMISDDDGDYSEPETIVEIDDSDDEDYK